MASAVIKTTTVGAHRGARSGSGRNQVPGGTLQHLRHRRALRRRAFSEGGSANISVITAGFVDAIFADRRRLRQTSPSPSPSRASPRAAFSAGDSVDDRCIRDHRHPQQSLGLDVKCARVRALLWLLPACSRAPVRARARSRTLARSGSCSCCRARGRARSPGPHARARPRLSTTGLHRATSSGSISCSSWRVHRPRSPLAAPALCCAVLRSCLARAALRPRLAPARARATSASLRCASGRAGYNTPRSATIHRAHY